MINRKFLKKGALVVVHRYDEARIPYATPKISHAAPYEVHFYPGMRQICAIGIERIRFTEPCSKKAPRVARWRA